MTQQPDIIQQPAGLSVIVVSFNAQDQLERCLDALYEQARSVNAEIIVVRDQSPSGSLLETFSGITVVHAPEDSTVPQMRTLGIRNSHGGIVALTEDDCIVSADYCQAVITAHQKQSAAIGSAVEPGHYETGMDWGIFFCEYGRFMPPFTGIVGALPGNNLSYKRAALDHLLSTGAIDHGFYEVFVNSQLQAGGQQLVADPSFSVRNENRWQQRNLFEVPFHHGRSYGGMRFQKSEVLKRIAYSVLSTALPALQTYRISQQVAARKRYTAQLLRALPSIFLFWSSWSLGECVGYLTGPGESLKHWR